MTVGRDAAPIPLLLLPGTLCDGRLWEHQVANLTGMVMPVVADITRDDSIAAMAKRILAGAPSRFLLAGLSMGGIVAFELVRLAPERVLGLALLDTTPEVPGVDQIDAWREEIESIELGRFASLLEERWVPLLCGASGSRWPSIEPIVRTMAWCVGPDAYAGQLRAQIGRRESWSTLRTIICPTLVLGGCEDTLCSPALHEAMASSMALAHLHIIEDCGHLSTLERPEEVTAALRTWVADVARVLAGGRQHVPMETPCVKTSS